MHVIAVRKRDIVLMRDQDTTPCYPVNGDTISFFLLHFVYLTFASYPILILLDEASFFRDQLQATRPMFDQDCIFFFVLRKIILQLFYITHYDFEIIKNRNDTNYAPNLKYGSVSLTRFFRNNFQIQFIPL